MAIITPQLQENNPTKTKYVTEFAFSSRQG